MIDAYRLCKTNPLSTESTKYMALPSTIRRFEIDLSDIDANVYEQISLRVAQHPSETDAYLVTRLIAYCLQFSEGVEMSKSGLSNADEPPLSATDLTGQMKVWIDIGLPSTERIHKASKRAEKVVITTFSARLDAL